MDVIGATVVATCSFLPAARAGRDAPAEDAAWGT